MKIAAKRKRIEDKIANLYNDIKELQKVCPHENLQGKYQASTGNYDPSSNSYWVNFLCQDCGLRWTEDQSDVRLGVTKDGFKFTKI